MFRVHREDIHYLRTTIESYDGMAVVRTVEPNGQEERVAPEEATIELLIAPGCEELVSDLLCALRDKEGVQLESMAA